MKMKQICRFIVAQTLRHLKVEGQKKPINSLALSEAKCGYLNVEMCIYIPCRQSQFSASLRTTSRTESISSALFGVMTFGPIVTGAGLAEDEVVRAEDLAVGARSDAVHGSRFEIHKHGSRNVPSARGLIVIDIDPLELDAAVAFVVVLSGRIDAVLVAYHLPELGTDLVTALASLNVQDLSHG
uniref:Uncharacterized protein n=1 Tax=Glycine max TaxID=3847 RepID=C6TIB5_SOYBN|nr:unknown [Glycine max]